MKTIVIKNGLGAIRFPIDVRDSDHVPPFAIHRSQNYRQCGWTITHLATGWSVLFGIRTRKRAHEIAKKIRHLDWNFKSPRSKKLRKLRPFVKPFHRECDGYEDES